MHTVYNLLVSSSSTGIAYHLFFLCMHAIKNDWTHLGEMGILLQNDCTSCNEMW